MLAKRIIPCLDVTGGRVVKGVNFLELRDAGDPVEIAARYNAQGADELTFLDITATSDGRDLILPIIEAVASQVFIPLTVGGGVRTVDDVRRLLNAGADKTSFNSAAIANPDMAFLFTLVLVIVLLLVMPHVRDVQGDADDDQGQDADRHVDQENPAPAGDAQDRLGAGEEPADQRSDDRGHAERGQEVALVLGPLPRREHVAHDRQRQRHQAAGAEALEGPEGRQADHRGRKA